MSLETKIETLTATIERLIHALAASSGTAVATVAAPVVTYETVAPGHVPPATLSVPASLPLAAAVAAAPAFVPPAAPAATAPAMPAPPSFVPPVAAAPAAAVAPFTDTTGLIKYVMDVYGALGADKGAGIQTVMNGLGIANINEAKPEQFNALYAGIEALRV